MDTGTSINLKNDVLEKLKNAFNDSSYRETIESSSNYNNRLVVERKTRVPFIDSQTGVAQNDCYLWMQKWERMQGLTDGQLYSYPKKRWRKKKRSQYLLNNNYGLNVKQWEKTQTDKSSLDVNCLNGHEATTEPVLKDGSQEQPVVDKFFENTNSKDDWMNELDDVTDFNDTIDNDDIESDYDEEYSSKKKKKKKDNLTSTGKKKKSSVPQTEINPNDKPYKCDLCGMKYKTRPGLSYHYSHTHSVDVENRKQISALEEEDSQQSNSSLGTTGANGFNSRSSQISNSTSNSPLPPNSFNNNSQTKSHLTNNVPIPPPTLNNNSNKNDKSNSKPTTPSSYCDFCLGNAEINKRTRTSEEMISCHNCGRSAHPTCLQFTPNMVKSVKSYPWECLECKSCGICGASDNDDQILFCDMCDRGYHSDCVGLKEIPEGEWSCNLCIEEYHKEKLTESNNINSNNNSNSNSSTNLNNANLNTNNNNANSNNITNNSHSNSKQQPLTTTTDSSTTDKS